ncbi:MAG: hypothetical protein ABFR33_05415 [Verrucomicrobiota bacterium]
MKRIIPIIIVAAAIAGVVVLKKSKSTEASEKNGGICPCEMIHAAQSNQTEAGASSVE